MRRNLRLLVALVAACAGGPAALAVAHAQSPDAQAATPTTPTTPTTTSGQPDVPQDNPNGSSTTPHAPAHPDHPVNDNNGADDPATLPPAAAPVLGSRVAVELGHGTVLVKLPLASHFLRLIDDTAVPPGSTIDARAGVVDVATRTAQGTVQHGRFWGGTFQVRQSRSGGGMTDIVLAGGAPPACARPASSTVMGHASRAPRLPHLWGSDRHGRFRTHGRNSVATVRGTKWLTTERCNGTVTYVAEGRVAVRDVRRHRTVTLSAGHAYLARNAG
jgi:hypothetical protein